MKTKDRDNENIHVLRHLTGVSNKVASDALDKNNNDLSDAIEWIRIEELGHKTRKEFDVKDISHIVKETNCTTEQAERSLRYAKGDVAKAIFIANNPKG